MAPTIAAKMRMPIKTMAAIVAGSVNGMKLINVIVFELVVIVV